MTVKLPPRSQAGAWERGARGGVKLISRRKAKVGSAKIKII